MRFKQPMRSAISHFGERIGGAAVVPTLPTTSLFAQYDASDRANQNPATGVFSPSAGSSSIDLQFKDSGGNASFSYSGTTQNGVAPISVPTTNWFAPASSGATSAGGITMLFAYRLNTRADGPVHQFELSGGGNMYVRLPSSGLTTFVHSASTVSSMTLANINAADGSFQVVGFIQKPSEVAFLSNDRSGDASSVASLLSASAPYPLHTSNVFADLCAIDWCELLLYNTASSGTLYNAMLYLEQKWNPT